jgi:hypothetical protein
MTTPLGRRKHSRYLLAHPIDGSLRLREEVTIEELGEREAVVLSPQPCRLEERMMLEVPGPPRRRIAVRVSECRPTVLADGVIRHRLRLASEHHNSLGQQGGGSER